MRRVAVTLVAAGALLFSFTAGFDPVAARADETLPEASSEASVEELPYTSGLVTSENDEVEASDEVKPEAEVEGEAEPEAETETEPEPEAEPEAGSETETVPDLEASETDADKDDVVAPETSAESEGTEDTENAEDAEDAEDEGVDLLAEEAEKDAEPVEMQRLYNKYAGEHFYTESKTERDALVKVGWTYEGVAWTAPGEGDEVFRLYNPYVKGGDHHYTMDAKEYAALAKLGWRQEGVGWYSAPKDDGVPLYRHYNPYATAGTHHYTTSMTERLGITAEGWDYEGVAWYGVDSAPSAPNDAAGAGATGWRESGGVRFWLNDDGSYATGWKEIGGARYWFDAKGRMATGPVDIDGKIYLFSEEGKLKTGFQEVAGNRYLFDETTGAMRHDGWITSGSSKMYIDPDSGVLAVGWKMVDGQLCDFGSDGTWVSSHSHNITWAGQPNNYYCGPTSGYMILKRAGKTTSVGGDSLTIRNVAIAMHTDWYGYTSYEDEWFARGMNDWLGQGLYALHDDPSYEELRNDVVRSYQRGYAPAISTDERRGGPHYNGHNNGSFSHLIVIDSYDQATDRIQFVDPGAGVLWKQASQKFWAPSLREFADTYVKGIHCAQ